MHRLEAIYIGARYEHTRALVEEMDAWLRINGVPSPELETMTAGSLQMIRWVGTRRPDVLLEGGEVLEWGPFRFEVLWTPGHSAGLVCLHDADRRILVSNDHVLERISPHIGMHAQSLGSPLANYLASLEMVRDLPVTIVLPGHGAPFRDLPGRVDQLIAHHRARLAVMLDLLHGGERTAYWVAGHLRWRGSESGWERLEPFQRRMALTETIAHLEYLYGAGQLAKHFRGGLAYFCPVQTLPESK
jgi:glyoxylase-like metal-dependent hydrolase (beta-lactamase superfamily II)